jgi:hypothetical protein
VTSRAGRDAFLSGLRAAAVASAIVVVAFAAVALLRERPDEPTPERDSVDAPSP